MKQIINVGQRVKFPPRIDPNRWIIKKSGDINVQYNKVFKKIAWKKLKAIADKTKKTCAVWNHLGFQQLEMGSVEGINYVAFPVPGRLMVSSPITVVIETKDFFEVIIGVKISDLAAQNSAADGQHKYEGI